MEEMEAPVVGAFLAVVVGALAGQVGKTISQLPPGLAFPLESVLGAVVVAVPPVAFSAQLHF
jgi:hypothetical protein